MNRPNFTLLKTALSLTLLTLSVAVQAEDHSCEPGIYANSQNEFIAIGTNGDSYRYLKSDGKAGEFNSSNENYACTSDAIHIKGKHWAKVPVAQTNPRFTSGDITLAGQLIMPADADHTTPMVIYAHGSEPTGWIDSALEPYQLLGRGVSVFVYDKRGTGASEGRYNQNFPLLTSDLVAAAKEARRLAGDNVGRTGFIGLSQGGWIAPLASHTANVDFVAIGYGLVADFTEEDADQVALELDALGYGDKVKAQAKKVTDITARMIKSNYRDGIEELTAFKQNNQDAQWLYQIKGSYTGVLIATDPEVLLTEGIPFFDSLDVDWSVDPIKNVATVEVEQYWALAEKDSEAPIEKTLKRLQQLQQKGKDIRIRIFPDSDHGMWSIGESKIVDGYFDSLADFAKGKLKPSYGDSWEITVSK